MLRTGMWVVDQDGRVGIFNVPPSNAASRGAEFHVADDHGRTVVVIPAASRKLTQARADQIPDARRPTPAVLQKFGYR